MIKIEREYVSGSGTKYVRTLDAKSGSNSGSSGVDEKVRWKSENRRIRRGRYLSIEQWNHIEEQVEEAYAMEYDVDFTSIFDIYPKDHKGPEGIIFYETYYRGDEQFGHSSNIIHIGAVGSYVPQLHNSKAKETTYNSTKTTSFKFYADKAAKAKEDAAAQQNPDQADIPATPEESPELSAAAMAQAEAEAAMKARIEAATKAKAEEKAAKAASASLGKAQKATRVDSAPQKKSSKDTQGLEYTAAAHHDLNITIQ